MRDHRATGTDRPHQNQLVIPVPRFVAVLEEWPLLVHRTCGDSKASQWPEVCGRLADGAVDAIVCGGRVNGDADRTHTVVGGQLCGTVAGAVAVSSQERQIGAIGSELLGGGESDPGCAADENEVAPRHT